MVVAVGQPQTRRSVLDSPPTLVAVALAVARLALYSTRFTQIQVRLKSRAVVAVVAVVAVEGLWQQRPLESATYLVHPPNRTAILCLELATSPARVQVQR